MNSIDSNNFPSVHFLFLKSKSIFVQKLESFDVWTISYGKVRVLKRQLNLQRLSKSMKESFSILPLGVGMKLCIHFILKVFKLNDSVSSYSLFL